MKKILAVFGTRPEAIKMASVLEEVKKEASFEFKVCVTAQHREMLDDVLELFEIVPDYDLDLMQEEQDLYDITANVMLKLKEVLKDFRPDLVLVHGDTTTTFASSLASFYQKIEVGHIEAGLRTKDIFTPWPEEANRQLTGILANLHFAPTPKARQNLLQEGKKQEDVVVTGNSVIDALFLTLRKIRSDKKLQERIVHTIQSQFPPLDSRFILVTAHRRENFGQGFINICKALKNIALKNPEVNIVYPLHPNPNVRKPAREMLSNIENIYLIDPLQYGEFVYLMEKSYFIITDSGGIQEEAPGLGKPVLVLRDVTERPEALEAGAIKLVGTDSETITQEAQKLLDNKTAYAAMQKVSNPYGDGKAAKRIVDFIKMRLVD